MADRPVIGFLTDFGLDGAAAICRGVMLSIARDAQIVDISHVVRKYAISDGAYLLRAALPWMPVGTHLGVVDPGVGTERRPIALRTGRGDILVGPDNGLLLPAAERLGGIDEVRLLENRAWMLPETSATFHGRDVFAPIAAHLAAGAPFADVGRTIDATDLVSLALPRPVVEPGRLRTGALYVDSFGNVRLAGGIAELREALGDVTLGTRLVIDVDGADHLGRAERAATLARTFGDVPAGELLVYEDSSGDLAIGESSGSAALRLGLEASAGISLRQA